MKKYLVFIIAFHICTTVFCQEKIEKYCFLVSHSRITSPSSNVTFQVYVGTIYSLFAFRDSEVIKNLKKVEKITTVTDVFNYMASLGWNYVPIPKPLINATEFMASSFVTELCFRRTFDKSEIR